MIPSKKRSKMKDDEEENEGSKKSPPQPSVTGAEFLAAKQVRPFLSKNKKSKHTKKEIMDLAGYLSNRGPIVLQHDSAEVYSEVSAVVSKIDELNAIPEFVEVADPIVVFVNWGAAAVPANYIPTLGIINTLQGGAVNAVGNAGQPIMFLDGVNCLLQLDSNETYERVVGGLKVAFPAAGQVRIIRMNPTAILTVT